MIDEKDLQAFFQDIEFMPPNDRDPREFIAGDPESEEVAANPVDDNMSGEEMFDGIEDANHEDHPDPQTYSDYYMFTDPAAKKGVSLAVQSPMANKLDTNYTQSDPGAKHSFSDVHSESLEQEAPEFPIHGDPNPNNDPRVVGDGSYPQHTGVRSMMEPSEVFNMNIAKNVVLDKPTYIEGKIEPAGTRIQWTEERK